MSEDFSSGSARFSGRKPIAITGARTAASTMVIAAAVCRTMAPTPSEKSASRPR